MTANVGTMRCTAYAPTYQNSTDLSAVLRIVRVSKSAFSIHIFKTYIQNLKNYTNENNASRIKLQRS